MNKKSNKLVGAGVLSAVAASLCCITPVLALISGASGVASTFSWMEPARPFLIGITVLVLGIAWYQKLKPRTAEEIECACEEDEKPSFWQSKGLLGIVTVFAISMLAFPNYAHIFYPSNDNKEVIIVNASDIQTVTFEVKGMTCNGCASHVENDVNKLPGIVKVDASYEESIAKVEFDQSKVSLVKIEEAINGTGYKVVGKK
ncbi:mercuric transport protein MerTP [Algoriphagus sp. AGSA1]|uniref:Mercuric transport protein MerT n=1 Tax=Algoriphagus yeomjeoni TaxID=291403 RepID=A0A327P767_9BACT|nr:MULTISPECIES: mercuric transport protein MerTP [Algoriphagus]MCE7054989.1 mercuric transport protein MerTP [Algoriphagus sp. AGSA1]RAI88108.1 copper ion binding protein [Algoriphagus yeomjeoni]